MISKWLSFILLLTSFVWTVPAHAASFAAGDLVKLSTQSDVYYVGADNKRYVFPNEKIYFSWYQNFSGIKTLSTDEMASLGIGGAVTYRPGTTLIKLTTDPKVYAVGHNGLLRWVETESAASALYGTDWMKKVHDLSDAFFTNYHLGTSIKMASDFSVSQTTSEAPTIGADKELMLPQTPPVPPPPPPPPPNATSTPAVVGSTSIVMSQTSLHAGDVITLTASSSHPTGILKQDVFFDGTLVKTCNNNPTCTVDVPIPISGTKNSYEAKVIATALNTTTLTATVSAPVDNSPSSLIKLMVGRSMMISGQAGEVVVQIDNSIIVLRTDIYIGGTNIKSCVTSSHECRWSDSLNGPVGKVFDVYAEVKDTIGRTYTTIHKSITIGETDSPVVTAIAGKSTIYTGETVDVSVSATDDDGVSSIEILQNGTVIKTCQGAAPCTTIIGPWNSVQTISLSGRATDTKSVTSTSEVATVNVTVQ